MRSAQLVAGLAFAGLLSTACTTADAPPASPRPVTAASARPAAPPSTQLSGTTNPDETVCKRMTLTGSTIPERICYTREQWASFDRNAKDRSDELEAGRREYNADGRGE